ncbi:hypothetical protein LMH87_000069 [Akanthomyces muscarius]|uniref:Asl1-like glycosyl hydrolase catalytic domain-containing protein n=1 Tax=Akanthomyces muscarius TaxID=2231603 RepID=A0A9W8QGK9_AKAMU|nr:hypothetical protein LMH87_000069 [Akanthomyces muscarius]KAJ4154793.1 hypothetical protein LMH87_000069 [Akanthomyces muscarius]
MVSQSLLTATVLATTTAAYKYGLAYSDGIEISGFTDDYVARTEITWRCRQCLETDFPNQCQGSHIDFVPVHWYNDHSMERDFENWVNSICSLVGNRKFKRFGNEHEQLDFLRDALPFLDNKSCVKRYAYFGINNANKDLIEVTARTLLSSVLGTVLVFHDKWPARR